MQLKVDYRSEILAIFENYQKRNVKLVKIHVMQQFITCFKKFVEKCIIC